MKYTIIDRRTNEVLSEFCIVTRDGLIAWWDDSAGWDIEENQENYEVLITEE